jgi:hypothetical protein
MLDNSLPIEDQLTLIVITPFELYEECCNKHTKCKHVQPVHCRRNDNVCLVNEGCQSHFDHNIHSTIGSYIFSVVYNYELIYNRSQTKQEISP